MNINDYVTQALRSEAASAPGVYHTIGKATAAIKVLIAAGALADALKKSIVYGKKTDFFEVSEPLLDAALALQLELRNEKRGNPTSQPVMSFNFRLLHAALGIAGEAVELLEAPASDFVNQGEELGDALWYVALGMDEVHNLSGGAIEPAGILQANIRKLQLRYPDKFTLAASEGRDVAAERATLEQM